jgi:hypothetical protein
MASPAMLDGPVVVMAPEPSGYRPKVVAACCVEANVSITMVLSVAKSCAASSAGFLGLAFLGSVWTRIGVGSAGSAPICPLRLGMSMAVISSDPWLEEKATHWHDLSWSTPWERLGYG